MSIEIVFKKALSIKNLSIKGRNVKCVVVKAGLIDLDTLMPILELERLDRKEINQSNYDCKIGNGNFEFANTINIKEMEYEINHLQLILERL